MRKPVRIGVGGAVGSGKTALADRRCRALPGQYELAVVTNDIYTKEDAEFLIRQGGDNLAPTVSPEPVGSHVDVIDVAEGDKIPRTGGPGITRSDLLVINKIDPAPSVGASLDVMERDARRLRGARPFIFADLVRGIGVPDVVSWIKSEVLFETAA